MNYSSLLNQEMKQSDEIFRKLNKIKNELNPNEKTSSNNLNDYLPNERLNSKQNSNNNKKDIINASHYTQTYRQSLQKKLQRLFKEERAVFNESLNIQKNDNMEIANTFEIYSKIMKRDAFTVSKMEQKIKQLERKYLDNHIQHNQNTESKVLKENMQNHVDQPMKNICQKILRTTKAKDIRVSNKKIKSLNERKENRIQNKPTDYQKQERSDKSCKKLLFAVDNLRKQLDVIKRSNLELNEKIQLKQQVKKQRKQRSKYLLKHILQKLLQIQQSVTKNQKQPKMDDKRKYVQMAPAQERRHLQKQNNQLMKQVQDLSQQLKKQMNQKEIAQETGFWMEKEFRKEVPI